MLCVTDREGWWMKSWGKVGERLYMEYPTRRPPRSSAGAAASSSPLRRICGSGDIWLDA